MRKYWLLILLLSCWLAGETLTLPMGGTREIRFDGAVARFANTNKPVVAVRQSEDQLLLLTGLKAGTAYLYCWDLDNQLKTYKIIVSYVKSAAPSPAGSGHSGVYETYFKFDPENSTPVNKRMFNQRLKYRTEFLGYNLNLIVEDRNIGLTSKSNIEQLSQFTLALSRGDNLFLVGDDTIQFTNLTVPFLSLQGARARVRLGTLVLDVFGGKKSGEYWGDQVLDHAVRDKTSNNLSGARVKAKINDNIAVGLTYAQAEELASNNRKTASNTFSGVDTRINYHDFDINLEYAAVKDISKNVAAAEEFTVQHNGDNYGYSLIFRDIDPRYQPLGDYYYYRGAQGYFFYGRYQPQKNLNISGYYENYFQRYNQAYYTITNLDYTQERERIQFLFNALPAVTPIFAYYQTLKFNPKNNINEIYKSYTLSLEQMELIGQQKLAAYAEFSPYTFQNSEDYVVNYSGAVTKLGLRSKLTDWFNLRLEHESRVYYYDYLNSDNPHGYNFIINFGTFTLPQNIVTEISYWFQNRLNSLRTLDQNRHSLRLSFTQNLTESFSWYLYGIATHENSLQYEYIDRIGYYYQDDLVRSEVSGGCSYKF